MTPAVSVVMPAYRSGATVAASLRALRRQTFSDFELVLVNSSPGDETAAAIRNGFPEATYVESQQRLLPHEARNVGVELASGAALAFTDPDCFARPDWLERLVEAQRGGHHLVTGAMDVAPEAGWFERGVHLTKFWWALPGLPEGPAWIAPSANVCYTRELWDHVGPFPGGFSGDARLSWRATAAGARPWFVPYAVVDHRHVDSTAALWRERRARGEEFCDNRIRHERWSHARTAATAVALPLLPGIVLGRAASSAARAGSLRAFASTLPVQALGQTAWSLGESRACLAALQRHRGR